MFREILQKYIFILKLLIYLEQSPTNLEIKHVGLRRNFNVSLICQFEF